MASEVINGIGQIKSINQTTISEKATGRTEDSTFSTYKFYLSTSTGVK